MSLESLEKKIDLLTEEELDVVNMLIEYYPQEKKISRNFSSLRFSVLNFEGNYFLLDKAIHGKGVFGKIKKTFQLEWCENRWQLTQITRAVKIIIVDKDNSDFHTIEIKTEHQAVKDYHNSYGYFYRDNEKNILKAYIDMPYFEGLDLFQLKHLLPSTILEKLVVCIEIAKELKRLHDLNYVHFDIKPSHIIFTKGQFKIIDLGLACLGINEQSRPHVGTPVYCAPELSNGIGSYLSDIYSLGVVFAEFLENKLFQYEDEIFLPLHIRIANFIESIKSQDPKSRPNLVSIIEYFEISLYEGKGLEQSFQNNLQIQLKVIDKSLCKAITEVNRKLEDTAITQSDSEILKKLAESYLQIKKLAEEKITEEKHLSLIDVVNLKKEVSSVMEKSHLTEMLDTQKPALQRYVNKTAKSLLFFTNSVKTKKFGLFKTDITEFMEKIDDQLNHQLNFY